VAMRVVQRGTVMKAFSKFFPKLLDWLKHFFLVLKNKEKSVKLKEDKIEDGERNSVGV